VNQNTLDESGWSLVNRSTQDVLNKIRKAGIPLGEYVEGKIYYGIKTGLNEAFVIDNATQERLISDDSKSAEVIKPFLAGRDIKRYAHLRTDKYLIVFPSGFTNLKSSNTGRQWDWMQKKYPAIAQHLAPFKEKAEKRYDKGEFWWELRACDYYSEFDKPKMMLPDISLRGNFALDEDGKSYCVNTAYIISSAEKFLLAILNSALITFFYKNISSTYRGGYLRFIYQYLVMLPIRIINFDDPEDVARHDRMVDLVEQMLDLNKKLAESRMPQETEMLRRRIESTDCQIDQLVYELYDLTEEEIKIVEAES
jgi:hypothetical protein